MNKSHYLKLEKKRYQLPVSAIKNVVSKVNYAVKVYHLHFEKKKRYKTNDFKNLYLFIKMTKERTDNMFSDKTVH